MEITTCSAQAADTTTPDSGDETADALEVWDEVFDEVVRLRPESVR
jgi:hypothetical protein